MDSSICRLFSSCRPSRIAARLLVLAAAAVVLLCVPAAQAQGTADMLPKPIDTRELIRYMDQLELSDQQQMAVTAMHDEYKRQFRQLYDDGLEEFLDTLRGMGGMQLPSRDEMNDIVNGMRQWEGRIRTLDNRLFDQMRTVLTEQQVTMLPRVRLARQRDTYMEQPMLQMWTMGSPVVDLSDVIRELELAEAHAEAIDPLVAQYERDLTRRLGSLHDAATKLWMDMYDALEAEGFTAESLEEMAMENPEKMQRFMEVIQNIFMELTAKGREDVANLRTMTRRSIRSFRGLVPEDVHRTIRYAYYGRAYPATRSMTMSLPKGTHLLEGIDGLTEDQSQQAEQVISSTLQQLDSLLTDAVELIDARRQNTNFMNFDAEEMQQHQERMNELRNRATELSETLNQRLAEILEPPQLEQFSRKVLDESRPGGSSAAMRAAAEAEAEEASAGAEGDGDAEPQPAYTPQRGPDQFLPPAISTYDLTVYMTLLDVGEMQRPIIRDLHRSYRERFEQIEEDEIAAVQEAQRGMWSQWNDEFDAEQARKRIDTLYERRRAAMEAIRQADEQFFDDVALVLDAEDASERMQRVRTLRHRQRLNRNQQGWYMAMTGEQSQESSVDVVSLTVRQRVDPATLRRLDSVFAEYEQAAAPLLQQQYDASMTMQRRQELWGLRWREVQQEEGDAAASATIMSEPRDELEAAGRRLAEADEQLAKLNQRTFEAVLAAAPEKLARKLREAYNRQAFPGAFNESESATSYIERAMKLPDLRASQRNALTDLRAEYQPKYEDNRMKFVKLMRDSPQRQANVAEMDPELIKQLQTYRDTLEQLKFERRELTSRALLRLQQILDEQQINAMGGLPELSDRNQR